MTRAASWCSGHLTIRYAAGTAASCSTYHTGLVVASTARADGGLDQPSKFTTEDGRSPNVRRLLVGLHDEYARHVGHADLLREAVDGLVGEDPPQP